MANPLIIFNGEGPALDVNRWVVMMMMKKLNTISVIVTAGATMQATSVLISHPSHTYSYINHKTIRLVHHSKWMQNMQYIFYIVGIDSLWKWGSATENLINYTRLLHSPYHTLGLPFYDMATDFPETTIHYDATRDCMTRHLSEINLFPTERKACVLYWFCPIGEYKAEI